MISSKVFILDFNVVILLFFLFDRGLIDYILHHIYCRLLFWRCFGYLLIRIDLAILVN